jgi:tetratricopeptide (TPR) repeat protein
MIFIADVSLADWNLPMSKKNRDTPAAKAATSAQASAAVCPAPPPGPEACWHRRGTLLAGGIIVLVALITYHNSFTVPFMLDDPSAIPDNSSIRHFWSALFPPAAAITGGRPLLNFTFALNYAWSGVEVWSYHAFNLVIHVLAGLTLFGIVRRTLREHSTFNVQHPTSKSNNPKQSFKEDATLLALAVAAIWVVHPLQTEAVTYISQRAESLMGLFYLLTLYCFVRGAESRHQASGIRNQEKELKTQNPEAALPLSSGLTPDASSLWFLASICSCLLGVMSKEVIVTAPVMVFLYDRTFVAGSFREAWRQRWRYYLGLAGTWLLLARLMTGVSQRGAGFDYGVTWWNYALTSCRSIALYLKLAFWPHPLVLDYGFDVIKQATDALPYVLVLILLSVGTVIALWRRPVVGFAGAWFLLILAPTTSIVPVVGQPMAEHRMYLPLAAVIALVVLGSYAWVGRRCAWGLLAFALVLGFLTERRNEEYRNPLIFWSKLVAYQPDNARIRNNFGLALLDIPGRLPDAIAEFRASVRIDPNEEQAHNNLGFALAQIPGRVPEVIAEFRAALRIDPDFEKAHFNLGNILMKVPGRSQEAIAEYEAALRIDPDSVEAHFNLGNALMQVPELVPEAIDQYEAALRIDPDGADAHYNLGNALMNVPGRSAEAITEYRAALRIDPNFAKAHFNLGNALIIIPGRSAEAMAEYEAALRSNPNFAEVHNALGWALESDPARLPDAIAHFEAAVRIKPDYADAHHNLANALMNIPGRLPEAIAEYEAVLRINPDDAEVHNNLGCALSNTPGRLRDAIAHFEAAVRIKPDYADAHENLGAVLASIPGKETEAMAELETALRLNPHSESAREKLAELRAAQR